MWSGGWSTFDTSDWWVSAAGVLSAEASEALGWCTVNGIDAEHCYARMISRTREITGTTRYNR